MSKYTRWVGGKKATKKKRWEETRWSVTWEQRWEVKKKNELQFERSWNSYSFQIKWNKMKTNWMCLNVSGYYCQVSGKGCVWNELKGWAKLQQWQGWLWMRRVHVFQGKGKSTLLSLQPYISWRLWLESVCVNGRWGSSLYVSTENWTTSSFGVHR